MPAHLSEHPPDEPAGEGRPMTARPPEQLSLPGVAPARLPRPPRPEADHLVTRADADGLRAFLARCRAPGEGEPALSWRSLGPALWLLGAGERAGLEVLLERWERGVEERARRAAGAQGADRAPVPAGAVPRPAGLEELELEDGAVYLIDAGDEHKYRVLGWYYGYPRCCVEAFIDRGERFLASSEPAAPPRPEHPVSGHLLCPACEAGPVAPLPPRPAERFGWAEVWDGELLLTPPSRRGEAP